MTQHNPIEKKHLAEDPEATASSPHNQSTPIQAWNIYPPESKDIGLAVRYWLPYQFLALLASIPSITLKSMGGSFPVLVFGIFSTCAIVYTVKRFTSILEREGQRLPKIEIHSGLISCPTLTGQSLTIPLDKDCSIDYGQWQASEATGTGRNRYNTVYHYVWLTILWKGEVKALIVADERLPSHTEETYAVQKVPNVPAEQQVRTSASTVLDIVQTLNKL